MNAAHSPATEAEHIAISKSKGIKIDWRDGHQSDYSLQYLRDHCPCASCTEVHGPKPDKPPAATNPFQMFKEALKIKAVHPAGAYALAIEWNDGHRSGIYSYDHLREMCPCEACAQGRTG